MSTAASRLKTPPIVDNLGRRSAVNTIWTLDATAI